MATEISSDLITQLKLSLRNQTKLPSSSDPISNPLPTASEAIETLEPSPTYLRGRNCKGKLLKGIESLICVFCGKQQRTVDNPPDPIKFTSTLGYRLFLKSLGLNGSEIVEPIKEVDGLSRGAKVPVVVKGVAVSKFLDLEIHWSEIDSGIGDGVSGEKGLDLGGVSVDDFRVETVVESKVEEEEDEFNDPRSLSLFDSVKSEGVVESRKKENVGLFKGVDAQKNENLSLFAGQNVQDSVSVADQGNFGFFEGKDAQTSYNDNEDLSLFEGSGTQRTSSSKNDESFGLFEGKDTQGNSSFKDGESFGLFEGNDAQRNSSSKENESFGLFEGKDAQRNSSSKDGDSFGFFEGKDAQGNSSSKDVESFGLFEGKDAAQRKSSSKDDESFGLFEGKDAAQRKSSSKDDESFGFFEGKDAQGNSSSKDVESFGLFEGKDAAQRKSSSKDDESFGLFEGKDAAQRKSSSKDDESFGFFEGAPTLNAGVKSSDDKGVASSSDWDSDFQSADRNLSQEKISGDPFVNSPIDMSAQMDSVFGSAKDFLPYEKTADSSVAYVSKGDDDWLQGDLFGNVTSKSQHNDTVHDQNVGGKESSSMDMDWIGDDLWQTNEKKPVEKTPADDYDGDDDWNDFAGSANKAPTQTMESSQEGMFAGLADVKSEDEKPNTGTSVISDIGKGQEDDIFGTWDSLTSSTILQTPVQPLTNNVNPSAEQFPEMNLFKATNNHRDLDTNLFTESIGGQTNSEEVKATPSGTSTLERTSDPAGKDQTTTESPKSKTDIAEGLMSQMHDLSFMLETELSVPPVSKTE